MRRSSAGRGLVLGGLFVVAFGAVLGAAAGRALGEEPDLARLVEDLGDNQDFSRRSAALTALQSAKDERAIPLLLAVLPRFDRTGRFYAVLVLDSYPEKPARAAFKTLERSDDPYLRLCAGSYLLRQGDPRGADLVVEALGVRTDDLALRQYMLNRLYGIADPKVLDALRAFLAPGEDLSVLATALQHLGAREDPPALEACRRLLREDQRPDARALAAAFLWRFGEAERLADLVALLKGGDLTTVSFYRVKTFLQDGGGFPPEVLAALTDLLGTEDDAYVLRAVIDLLAEAGHAPALGAIQKHLKDASADVSRAAFEAVLRLGGAADRGDLAALLADPDPDRRVAAANLLRRMDDLSGLPVVVEVLRKGTTEAQRISAARSLGGFRVRAAVDPLLEALADPAANVRAEALRSVDALFRALFPYRRLDFVAAGYVATGPEAERAAALAKIRAWWDAHRAGGW